MKLGLGTVQFGLDYGIEASRDRVSQFVVKELLAYAARHDINVIDTAALYGCSEMVLGKSLPQLHSFKIVTKTPFFDQNTKCATTSARGELVEPFERSYPSMSLRRLQGYGGQTGRAQAIYSLPDVLEKNFLQSLENLRQSHLYGLLVHRADDLLQPQGELLWQRMELLKHQNLVSKIGVSVYTAAQIDALLERYNLDLIQLPFNVFDQRLLHSGHLQKLKQRGVEIHARSVFLQGLLLQAPEEVPPGLCRAKPFVQRYHAALRDVEISPAEASLAFALMQPEIDYVIVGVRSLQQLKELIVASQKTMPAGFDYSPFAVHNESVVNPSLWKLQ